MPDSKPPLQQRLLTYEDVADLTGLSPGTIRYLRHKGTGPRGFKLGRRVRFTQEDVQAWIRDRRRAAA